MHRLRLPALPIPPFPERLTGCPMSAKLSKTVTGRNMRSKVQQSNSVLGTTIPQVVGGARTPFCHPRTELGFWRSE